MRALRRLRGNVGKLGLKAAGALWPPNTIVIGRNSLDQLRTDPWSDFIARSDDPAASLRDALEQAVRWLALAQDRSGAGGVASYEFYGWTKPYPEVTGYIIPTMWDCRHGLDRPDLGDRAVRMSDWELEIQRENGGWEAGVAGENQEPIVFNTGQVIRGLLRTHAETGERRYLDAAVRAADWIVDVQEDDGSWTRANYRGLKRVYDSYVSAPLARAAEVTGNRTYAEAAMRNCEFVLRQQRESGWFDLCDNSPFFVEAPVTHAIGYTIDGLLETGDLVGRDDFVAAATKAADGVMGAISASGRLAGRLDEHWESPVRWVCLTGTAQIGIVLVKLYARTGEPHYLDAARRLADFLVYVQHLNAVGTTRSGALPGSYPVWGTYAPFKYPCWATKYLVDLLVMLERLARDGSPSAGG
jgi:rhamnogalacturonyl hydrolase YesR